MSVLFSPIIINNLALKNRIVMSPMCLGMSDNQGFVKEFHHIHYGARAIGQVGLIIIEATSVSPEGRITDADLGIWNNLHLAGLKELCETIKQQGSKAGIQIAHAGRKSNIPHTAMSCSNVVVDQRYSIPIEMTLEDIATVQDQFISSVKRAIEAGFDVIEIHAAHGYLIHQFLSPITNNRKDNYGDSPENRARFLKEILTRIREFYKGVLFVRISATDYKKEGLQVTDYIQLFKDIDSIDFVDVSSGGIIDDLNIKIYPGYQVPLSKMLKKHISIPVGAVGIIKKAKQAEKILQQNKADLIFLGRALNKNPNWAIQAAHDLKEAIDLPKAYKTSF
ncbi:MAG: NADPH dehydrogenase NamA [Spirochaetota bacterium]|nr:NADPH dehydrogenase NamA [Spirochaetota bacterium]